MDNFLWAAVAYAGFLYMLHGISNLTYLTQREVMEFLIMKFIASTTIIAIHAAKSHYSEYFARGEWARVVAIIDTVMGFAFLIIGSKRTFVKNDNKPKQK
jgi:roadblock/LC7 domain-containing protein